MIIRGTTTLPNQKYEEPHEERREKEKENKNTIIKNPLEKLRDV